MASPSPGGRPEKPASISSDDAPLSEYEFEEERGLASDSGALWPQDIRMEWEASWAAIRSAVLSQRMVQERLMARLLKSTAGSSPVVIADSPSVAQVPLCTESRRRFSLQRTQSRSQSNNAKPPTHHNDLLIDVEEMLFHMNAAQVPNMVAGYAIIASCRLLELVRMWLSIVEPPRTGYLAEFVNSVTWTAFINLSILANAIFMVVSVDFQASNIFVGVETPPWMQIMEIFFVVIFGLELCLKLFVHRLYLWCNQDFRWNLFDAVLVLLSLYDIMSSLGPASSNQNILFLRTLRVVKIARTFRIVRVLRHAQQLRRMIQSVLGSMVSLFWAFCMMLFVLYLFSIATVQAVTGSLASMDESALDDATREAIEDDFGSVAKAILVYFISTTGGADWVTYFGPLRTVSPLGAAFFVLAIAFFTVALFNILTGIFVENAMKVAIPDASSLALEQRRQEVKDAHELRQFLVNLGFDCSGSITLEDFHKITGDPRVYSAFAVLGLEIKDAEIFFEMISDGDGGTCDVSFESFIEVCLRLKGPASNVDVQALLFKMQTISDQVGALYALHTKPTPSRQLSVHM